MDGRAQIDHLSLHFTGQIAHEGRIKRGSSQKPRPTPTYEAVTERIIWKNRSIRERIPRGMAPESVPESQDEQPYKQK